MWNLKYNSNELIYKAETDSLTQRTDLWWPRGEGLGIWDSQMQGIIQRIDKQSSPNIQHKELYSIFYDNRNDIIE